MRIFTVFVAFVLVGIGVFTYRGSADAGGEPSITAAIPAFVGAGMLLGVLVSLGLRKTGLQLAYIAALLGVGLGLGRLIPSHLDGTLVPGDPFSSRLLVMAGVCLLYVLVLSIRFLFRPRPLQKAASGTVAARGKTGELPSEPPLEA